ncbi:glycerophosphodiester phosphodiesterase [Rhizobacter sp. AJA081-3]|nr:glycerophosphodiester phosphodiesterase [Rhizobacter sp. AJA081-3]
MLVAVGAIALSAGACAFDLQGHRGARGLAPENTLAAFERALEIGVTTLETDVHLSADGILVISHDPRINPDLARDAQGAWVKAPGPLLRDLTLAQIQAFDVGRLQPGTAYARGFPSQQPVDGQRIPTLAALFQKVRELGADGVRFNIEIKMNPHRPEETPAFEQIVDALLALVKQAGMEGRVTVQGFDWRALQRVQQRAPGLPTAYLSAQTPRFNTIADGAWTAGFGLAEHGTLPKMVKAAGGTIWSPNFDDLNARLVDEAHALGLQVIPWTVNESADMERLIGWGVDGLITDYPDRARAVLRARGLPLPAAQKN